MSRARNRRQNRTRRAFTIIELLVVMAIIIVLAGLILGTSGYVQKKGARSRAEAEIAALSAALESYKADNGVYPSSTPTNQLSPAEEDITRYRPASQSLYAALSGDTDFDAQPESGARTYFSFKPQLLGRLNMASPPSSSNEVTYIRDPFGNSYGYSTAKNPDANPSGAATATGNNPTFDLWSTGGSDAGLDQSQWIRNW